MCAVEFLKIEVNEESFPWISNRKNPNAKPTLKIISRSMTLSYTSVVMLHEAGAGYVKNYYMKELLADKGKLKKMDPKDVQLMNWVINSEQTDPLEDIRQKRQQLES